ncbi:hypothetical protein GGD83_001335 [Rhodoblastus sphagnicola]|nr:hypothetical protein [Rhodoblastus sphagnicola]MBB4197543.1 hypothetical protein [Rhodoblastus sphagnicola]
MTQTGADTADIAGGTTPGEAYHQITPPLSPRLAPETAADVKLAA